MPLTVITPSHLPDIELCAQLARSVKLQFPSDTEHVVIVPREQVSAFSDLQATIVPEEDYIPSTFIRPPGSAYSFNLTFPIVPIRGWIRQQIIKLAAASEVSTSIAVMVDSDITFTQQVRESTFKEDNKVILFRKHDEIDETRPRHVKWHKAARRLLALPEARMPYPDYVSSLIAWEPVLVRACLARVAAKSHFTWQTAIGRQLHFSEWTLYGAYVDAFGSGHAPHTENSRCHDYWEEDPLNLEQATSFLEAQPADDIAYMISAKSRTSVEVRKAAHARVWEHTINKRSPQ